MNERATPGNSTYLAWPDLIRGMRPKQRRWAQAAFRRLSRQRPVSPLEAMDPGMLELCRCGFETLGPAVRDWWGKIHYKSRDAMLKLAAETARIEAEISHRQRR